MSAGKSSILEWLQLQSTQPHTIFYSSLGAVIASTFLAIHLNIPSSSAKLRGTGSPIIRAWHSESARQARRWVFWGIAVVIAPELLVSIAFGDWRAAMTGRRVLMKIKTADPKMMGRLEQLKGWDLARISFANMGGTIFEMTKGEAEIPDSAPFWEDGHYIDEYNLRVLWSEDRTANIAVSMVKDIPSTAKTGLTRLSTGLLDLINKGAVSLASVWPRCGVFPNTTTPNLPRSPVLEDIELNILERSAGGFDSTEAGYESEPVFELQNILRELDDSSLQMPHPSENNSTEAERRTSLESPMRGQDKRILLHLNAIQIAVGCLLGVIETIPSLDMDEVNRQCPSKILKGLAIIQLAWFGIGTIISLCTNQAITHLEVAASTYLLCALVSYTFFWSKPQGITQPVIHRVETSQNVRPVTDHDLDILRRLSGSPFLTRNFIPPFGMDGYTRHPADAIPNGTSLTVFCTFGHGGIALFDDDFAGTIAGTIFGMLYALGWDRPFPSTWEQIAWLAASAGITGSLIPYSAANALCTIAYSDLAKSEKPRTHVIHSTTLATLLALYVACRVYMLSEMFRLFFYTDMQ